MRVQRLLRWVTLFLIGSFGLVAVDSLRISQQYQEIGAAMVAPFSWASSSAADAAARTWTTVVAIGGLQQETQRLRAENAQLRAQNIALEQDGQENATLRQLLGYKVAHPHHTYLPARVIARGSNNLEAMLTLDVGAREGIKVGMAVVDSSGLVGRIVRISPHAAVVLPIDDPASAVAGYVYSTGRETDPKSNPTGVVQYEPGMGLLMKFVAATAPLQRGNLVLTSGLGGTFPLGVPIGTITQLTDRPVDLFQLAVLTPLADLKSSRQLLVITDFVPPALPDPAP